MKDWLHFLFSLLIFKNYSLSKKLKKIKGLTSYLEDEFLFICARDARAEGRIVEIGSYQGRSSIALAYGSYLRDGKKILSIDPFLEKNTREAFISNVRRSGLFDYIQNIEKFSIDVAKEFKGEIRFLFIDGSHKYEDVKTDIIAWKGFLSEGAVIAIHDFTSPESDYFQPGVNKAIEECLFDDPDFIVGGIIDSLIFIAYKRVLNKEIFERFRRINRTRISFYRFFNKCKYRQQRDFAFNVERKCCRL